MTSQGLVEREEEQERRETYLQKDTSSCLHDELMLDEGYLKKQKGNTSL